MAIPEPKRASRRRNRRRRERSSLQILEEAFHLLRTTPIGNLWIFYVGAVPFAAAFLYFVADMSRSTFAARDALPAALMMVGLYFWLTYFQAKFCAALWNTINPGQAMGKHGWQKFRYTAALWCLQAFAAPAFILGLFFLIPIAWIVAALQNIKVLAFTQDYDRQPLGKLFHQSLRCSHDEWAQNHGILIIVSFIGLFMWVNILSTCIIVPLFAKSFLGVDSMFTENPEAVIQNSTFLFATLLINWLVLSPVLKAVYVIRCFYAESRTSGADLLSRLESCRKTRKKEQHRERTRKSNRAAAIAIGLGLLFCGQQSNTIFAAGTRAKSAEPARSVSPPPSAEQLEKAISEIMEQKKYQWKIPRHSLQNGPEDQSWLSRKVQELSDSIEAWGTIIMKKIDDFFKRKTSPPKSGKGLEFDFRGLNSSLSIILMLVVAGLVTWLAFVMVKRYKGRKVEDQEESGFSGIIDLESEDIVASQLPEDEWMRLAQEQISKGQTRLAIRALFLAGLARLGERGLLKIARFKSNRAYRTELELRVRHRTRLREAFEENTSLFERVWYGLHEIGDDAVKHFMENYEKISRASQSQSEALISSKH